MALQGRALVVAMCIGQVGSLLPHVVLPSVMAQFLIPEWHLSAAEAGFMASCFAVGYMIAVPVLATLTDRIDARTILIIGSLLSALATFGVGKLADGIVSASVLWGLAGLGFAGAYMPGLRALTDRLPPGEASRSITLYTASYSLGVGLSFLAGQLIAEAWGWRAAFVLTALGPLVMVAIALMLAPHRPRPGPGKLLDFGPVLRNRAAMGYILGYGVHCFELYGVRTWLVAFWTFVAAREAPHPLVSPIIVSVIVTVLAMPASIVGNEAALRLGRHRAIGGSQLISGAVALAIGFMAGGTGWVLLALMLAYAVTVPFDSGALTSGMSMSAAPELRGATMALHSTVGFGMSALGSWLFGVALEAAGGPQAPSGWLAGFALLAAVICTGPLILAWSRRGQQPAGERR